MKKITVIVFVFVLLMMFTAIAPVFAKNLNYPEGYILSYYDAGHLDVALPQPLPTNYPASATAMRLIFHHVEIPNANLDYCDVMVQFFMSTTLTPTPEWMPYAIITTSPYSEKLNEMLWYQTLAYFNATKYGLPAIFNTDNVILVDEDVLKVERHGNNVYASLTEPIQLDGLKLAPPTPNLYFTMYPFTAELNSYGGSFRYAQVQNLLWPYSTGYTFSAEEVRFNAVGTFTSAGLNLNVAAENATVVMHGTHVYSPP